MDCYEGATMIKTFRGLMADGAQDTIVLHTNDGSTGYRIVKFQLMGPNSSTDIEHVLKIYKIKQTTITSSIDFSDQTLLAAAVITDSTGRETLPTPIIIFDKEVFNQDIYITSKADDNAANINYYLELEQVKLDMGESTVATLKDIRNLEYPRPGG